jgi:hypothetical protein
MEEPLTNTHFRGVIPFKLQVKFDIPLFEGQIGIDALEKWLSLLEDYFSIQKKINGEKITFAHLKAFPHVRYWSRMSLQFLDQYPLGYLFLMPSSNNITLLKTMTTSTRDGPHYVKRGAKQCQSSQIPSIIF